MFQRHTFEKSKRMVEKGPSSSAEHGTIDSVAAESVSTTIKLASGSLLRSVPDSRLPRDHVDSATRCSAESGRRAPVGGFALTPPPRSPERSAFNARELAAVKKVDRGCSPFRYSELQPLAIRKQDDATWRCRRTVSPSGPPCSFTTSPTTGDDRHVINDSLSARSTEPWRNLCRAVDYPREVLERQRHLQVLESNRTLEKFMRVLRREKEAKATADMFATPCTANHRNTTARTISFAVDGESRPVTSSALTSSRAETRNTENKPARSTILGTSPTDRRCTNDYRLRLSNQRHPTGRLKALDRRDAEEDWIKCIYDQPWRASTPRPAR